MADTVSFDEYLGPWWDEPRVMAELGLSEQQLAAWRHQLRIIGIQFNDHRHYYPARQFTTEKPASIVHGLNEVLTILNTGIHDPDTWATWLAGEYDEDMSVYDALHLGQLDHVLLLARRDTAMWRN